MAAKKKVDPKQWLSSQLAKLPNLTEEEKRVAQRLFGMDGLYDGFGDSYMDVAEHHSQIDTLKNDLEGQNVGWQQAYFDDLLRHGDTKRLREMGFGEMLAQRGIREDSQGRLQDQGTGEYLTRDEARQLFTEFMKRFVDPARTTSLGWTNFLISKAPQYQIDYGKPLDVAAFQAFAAEGSKKYGDNLDAAWNDFTAEDRKTKDTADREKWKADTRKEIERDIRSQLRLPEVGSDDLKPAPFFSRPAPDAKSGDQRPNQPYSYSIAPSGNTNLESVQVVPLGKDGDGNKSAIAEKYKGADLDFSRV